MFIFNLIHLSQYEAIQKLDFVLQSAQVTLESLNVKPVFQLNLAERDALIHSKKEQDNIFTSPDNNENTKLISHEN